MASQKVNFISIQTINDAGESVQNFINSEHVLLVRTEDNYVIIKLTNGEILKVIDIPIYLIMDKFYH